MSCFAFAEMKETKCEKWLLCFRALQLFGMIQVYINTIFSFRRWKEMLLISLFHFWSLIKQNGGNILPNQALVLKWAWSLGTRSHSGQTKLVLQDTNTSLSSSTDTQKIKGIKKNLLPMRWVPDRKQNKFWFYETHLRLNHPLALKNFTFAHYCN